MTSTTSIHRQIVRWIGLLASGFVALGISVILIRARRPSILTSSEAEGDVVKLRFQQDDDDDDPSRATKNNNATFKIMQIADIHLGENSWTDWGPEQDVKTFRLLDSVIVAEQPDLIVLTGDQITGNNIDANATAYYQLLGEKLSYYGIPWALIFGNHDDAPLEKDAAKEGDGGESSSSKDGEDSIIKTPAKTSREQLLAVDQRFQLSLSQSTPGLFGTSNYYLNVYHPLGWKGKKNNKQETKPALQLFFLDSGGGSLDAKIDQSQIDWFQKTHISDDDGDIPIAVFQHIPTKDYQYDGRMCRGLHDDKYVDTVDKDPGIVQTLQNIPNVRFMTVGHNHGNDYCCATDETHLHLCFGRHSGYGGYGKWDRGTRIYELELVPRSNHAKTSSSSSSLHWKSYVRMEDGTIVDPYDPQSPPRKKQNKKKKKRDMDW